MESLFRILVLMFLGISSCLAQSSDEPHYDPKTFISKDAADAEVNRISKLQPLKSPVLNESTRHAVMDAVSQYRAASDRLKVLTSASLEKVTKDTKSDVAQDFDSLGKNVAPCNESQVKELTNKIMGSYNYPYDSLQDVRLSQGSAGKDPETWPDLHLSGREFCKKFPNKDSLNALQERVNKDVDSILASFDAGQAKGRDMMPLIPQIVDEWNRYKKVLESAEEDSASTAGRVADQLGWIIFIFCGFAIFIFLAVRAFSDTIQYELVVSGQVIQFATVIVILVVLCILGMSGKISENTLGTLLGGVGGYVLSQGVGRAAGRQAGQAVRDQLIEQRPDHNRLPNPNGDKNLHANQQDQGPTGKG
jgi:hypothetical protein